VDVLHSTEFIMGLIRDNRISFSELDRTVTYHDPCDLGRASGIYDEPRSILRSIPGLRVSELRENREYCNCCGSGGDLLVSNQDVSLGIAKRKLDEVLATGAAAVVTACPSCVRSLTMAKNANKMPISVADITQLVLEAMVKTGGNRS
jgi:heterodisulfide reductase subunit D